MVENPSNVGSISRLRQDFEASLRADASTRVEAFRDTRDDETDRELLKSEISFRLRQGELLSADEFSLRFPRLADEVADLLTASAGDTPADRSLAAGSQLPEVRSLGDYELLETLGRGGMGVVYRARQRRLNRIVAVKTIASGHLANDDEVRRFRQEAEAAARLDHPGIVPVFEIGESDGVTFFSMGFVDGESLSQRLQNNPLPPYDAAKIVRELAQALHYAHESGVLHRDLKPANILIDKSDRVRIADFGLAKLVDRDGMTTAGAVVGTPSYMSPEQASGTKVADRRTDVYGLGTILYTCLSGQAPFRGHSTMDTLKKVVNDRPIPLRQRRPGVPHDLETICAKCLEKDPQLRYETAHELADELTRFIDGHPILARPVPVWTRAAQWCRRKPLIAGMTAAMILLLIVGSAVSGYFAVLAGQRGKSADLGFSAARQQSELSLRTLQTVIHSVQTRLAGLEGAREIRRDILQQVLNDLEEVGNGYVEAAKVDRESAKVLFDLATLYLTIGGEVGSDYSEFAETHFSKSVETYAVLLDEGQVDLSFLQEAFSAALDCGNNSREFRHFDKAIWAHQHALRFANELKRRFPEKRESKNAMLQASEALGEAMLRAGRVEESRPFILSAVRGAEQYAGELADVDAYDRLALCYCTEGDLHRISGDLDAAAASYQRMSEMTLKLMELEPDNEKLLLDRSTDFERLGDLEMARKNYAKAIEHFELSRENTERYMAGDPTDLFRKQQSTWAYSKLAEACAAIGDEERAKWALAELAKLKSEISTPETPQGLPGASGD